MKLSMTIEKASQEDYMRNQHAISKIDFEIPQQSCLVREQLNNYFLQANQLFN